MCRFLLYIGHFSMIAWPALSCNACNTLHLMGIVRTKRVYLRIPSIGVCTYMTVLKKKHWVLNFCLVSNVPLAIMFLESPNAGLGLCVKMHESLPSLYLKLKFTWTLLNITGVGIVKCTQQLVDSLQGCTVVLKPWHIADQVGLSRAMVTPFV